MIEPLMDTLLKHLMKDINKDRSGKNVNVKIISDVIKSFMVVDSYQNPEKTLYDDVFEPAYLKETGDICRRLAHNLKRDLVCSDLILQVFCRLLNENERSKKLLSEQSHEKVWRECKERLITDYQEYYCDHFHTMFEAQNLGRLRTLYQLMSWVENGVVTMIKVMKKSFMQIAREKLEQYKEKKHQTQQLETTFYNSMAKVLDQYIDCANVAFDSNEKILSALRASHTSALVLSLIKE